MTTSHRLVVISGLVSLASAASAQNCTWERRVVPGPEFRAGAKMAFDAQRNVVALFGGGQPGPVWPGNTWEWDGTAWTQASTAGPGGGGRIYHGFVYDTVRQVTLLFGGHGLPGPYNNDLWSWDGISWAPVTVASTPPPARNGMAMAFDTARGVAVMFGGYNGVRLNDTWEWDGVSWTPRASGGPPARIYPAMAYDKARGVTVLFGGNTPTYLGDTWEWNGTTWTQRLVAGPPGRAAHGMTYDPDRHVVLLFGGLAAGGLSFDDTWEWDGTTWTQIVPPAAGPSARYNAPIAFDESRDNTVMFGGLAGGTWADDTWILDCDQGCYSDCNESGTLTIADFGCFQAAFAAGNMYADCNGSATLTIADFGCFQALFAAGCP